MCAGHAFVDWRASTCRCVRSSSVDQQGAAEGVEDGAGVGVPALFQPDVVVDRDLGRRGFFLAPQARRKA